MDYYLQKAKSWISKQLYLEELSNTSLSTESAVFKLIKDNKLKTIKDLLMTNQIKINDIVFGTSGHSLLHETVVMNRYEIFVLGLAYGGDMEQVDKGGATVLMKACALGRTNMVKGLIQRGARLDHTVNGEDCRHKAVRHEQWQVVDYIDKQIIDGK